MRTPLRSRTARIGIWLLPVWIWSQSSLARHHEVKPGESLWVLAKRYGVSVEALEQANGLSSPTIRAGQKLAIPTAKAQATAKPPTKSPAQPGVKADTKSEPAAKTPANNAEPKSAAKNVAAKPTETSVVKSAAKASKDESAETPARATPALAAQAAEAPSTSPAKPASPRARSTISYRTPPREQAEAEALYANEVVAPPSTLEEVAPSWVLERPGPRTQIEKSDAARGGIYPCVAPDPGFGAYDKWVQVAPMAHVLAPTQVDLGADDSFDLVFHFHGREPIRKEWVRSTDRVVLAAVDVGIDTGAYATAFSDPRTFGQVLRAIEAEIAKRSGRPNARVGRVALSAWSAGAGAVEKILEQPLGMQLVDAVILLDGLHAGYSAHSLAAERLAPFVAFAEAASKGKRLFFLSHSSIQTQGYASTTETAQYLAWRLGGRPKAVEPAAADPMGLERITAFSSGGFHVRGFRGIGAADHCAQLALTRDVLRVHLLPRWQKSAESSKPQAIARAE